MSRSIHTTYGHYLLENRYNIFDTNGEVNKTSPGVSRPGLSLNIMNKKRFNIETGTAKKYRSGVYTDY